MRFFFKFFFLMAFGFSFSQDWDCPVKNGIMKLKESYHYKVSIANLGINSSKDVTIHSPQQSSVFSISEGEVSRVFFIDNKLKAILIKNGNEQFSYSNLSAVKVSKGDEVKAGTELGVNAISTFSEAKNDFLLKFQYWSNQEQLDVFDRLKCIKK